MASTVIPYEVGGGEPITSGSVTQGDSNKLVYTATVPCSIYLFTSGNLNFAFNNSGFVDSERDFNISGNSYIRDPSTATIIRNPMSHVVTLQGGYDVGKIDMNKGDRLYINGSSMSTKYTVRYWAFTR